MLKDEDITQINYDIYEGRNPQLSHYYRCVEAHFEELEKVWDDRYASRYGFFRPYIMDVIYRYLDCGDLHCGFARVKCNDCGHEFLVGFSCKRRHFCPSCHQKRVVEFGVWLCEDVLKDVPHRHWVYSIPKRLRIYFMFDRSLLAKLSKCAWNVLSDYLITGVGYDDAKPGAVIAVQTFSSDFLEFNCHLHIISTDGCFDENGVFIQGPIPNPKELEERFRYEILKMLKKEGKINEGVIENMMGWHHSGFNIYCGERILPYNEEGLEKLARYIIRASFSQERMIYIPANESDDNIAKVIYTSKDGNQKKIFDAIDWLAQLITHIPNKGEQIVRYYGFYSNKSRGLRKKADTDDNIPNIIDTDISKKAFRKNWARLIQKIYNVNPLLCPKCQAEMKIISFIEDDSLIRKILEHLEIWDKRNHDPPKHDKSHITELVYDESDSQIPSYDYF